MDHSPAGSIMQKSLSELSKKLLWLWLELLDYNIQVIYLPGHKQTIADALSRYPSNITVWPFSDPSQYLCSPQNTIGCNFEKCVNTVNTDDPNLERFYNSVSEDTSYCAIVKELAKGLT